MWECCKPEQVTGHNDPFGAATLLTGTLYNLNRLPKEYKRSTPINQKRCNKQ